MTILPPRAPGLRIGLYGGSFNPPHAGHVHVSLMALRRVKLDRIWWVVTPGNPLKAWRGLPPIEQRIAAARKIARDRRIVITGFEANIGARYTLDTLTYAMEHGGGARFVWIMGADNLAQFDRWRGWRFIAAMMPFAVIDRPGWTLRATQSRAALALARYRIDETDALLLPDLRPPAWVFLHGPRSTLSSTVLRQQQSRTF